MNESMKNMRNLLKNMAILEGFNNSKKKTWGVSINKLKFITILKKVTQI